MFHTHREQARAIVQHWSLQEKIGQLFILAFPGKAVDKVLPLIERYNLGGCYLSQDNASDFAQARQLTQALQAACAQRAAHVPLLLGVDQEGAWSVVSPDSSTGPGNLALGSANAPELTAMIYQMFGEEMRSAGFNCILAPCADINLQANSPIIDTRAFGEIPARVAEQVAAAVHGAQQGGIVACTKHFPGHGDTLVDSHRDLPSVDKPLEQLLEQDLLPFQAAVNAGVELVMTSHIRYPQIDPDYPATLSAPILHGILRERLGFTGIVISDSMNMGAIRKHFPAAQAVVRAFDAGIDMMMLSEEHYDHDSDYLNRQIAMMEAFKHAVEQGEFALERLNQIVERVVALKLARLQAMPLYQTFDAKKHDELAYQAAYRALKLRRDPAGLLPLTPRMPIVLVQTTPTECYANLTNPRGIGPNQTTSAFDYFAQALGQHLGSDNLRRLDHAQSLAFVEHECVDETTVVLAVLEAYPLPGEDFDQYISMALTRKLIAKWGRRVVVVALRNGYFELSESATVLCAYGSRACSAQAAAKFCVSEQQI